ncbi:MAG: aldose 1-epimerase family protein [Planctomycetes bacterium]|nr:aldose 1-epimerase family protein [Planctomycetota bacterium]
MKRYKSWTLTDVHHDLWLDNFATGNERLHFGPADWSIRKRTLRGGLRDGVDLVEVDNGALSFCVLPTRGMGLWRGNYRGLFLGWKAPIEGPVHPKFVNVAERGGLGWLAGFDEWLCRCGLSWNGPPGEDVYSDRQGRPHSDQLTLHGRIANQPAHYVEARVNLDPPHEIGVLGQVEEGGLFSPRLHLTTTYTTAPGSNRLVIHDLIENRGALLAEMQILYHCNLGPPFLEAGSRVIAPFREVAPISPRAAEGIDTLDTFAGPAAGFAEQVYCYDLLADSAGRTLAMLFNHAGDKAVVLRFNRQELPCFTVWKNTMAPEEGNVAGLEPATNYPNFKSFERQRGRVPVLPPGGRWETSWSIEVHDSSPGVAMALQEVVKLQAQAKAVVHRTPQSKFSGEPGA